MHLSIWDIKVNGRSEQFATRSTDIETVLIIYKSYFKNKYTGKAFNFESIERVRGIEVLELDEITQDI